MRLVLAIPVLGLLAGAAAGVRWPDVPNAVLVAALVGWLSLGLHAFWTSTPDLLPVAVCGAFLAGGWALASDAWHRAWRSPLRLTFEAIAHDGRVDAGHGGRTLPEDDEASMIVEGVLRSDAALTDGGTVSIALDVDWAGRVRSASAGESPAMNPVSGAVLLSVLGTLGPARLADWRAGRRIRAPADLRRVARYLDPGVPDQERALARRGIALVGTVKSAALVELVARGTFAGEWAARLRAFARRSIVDAVGRWSPRAAGIITAIVIGDRTGLDSDVERRLQEAGTYHVIAISGGNIAILAALTLAAFRIAGTLGRTAMLAAAAALVAYGFIVGGGASVNRAVLMAVVYFVGRGWDLRGPPFHALLLVAGILVLSNPLSVADAATLLTFGATAGLVCVSPVIAAWSLPRVMTMAVAMLAASAAAEAALLPVSATLFSRITIAGLVLNFAAIPLMAVAQLAGMAVVPLDPLWPAAARVVGWIAYAGAEGLVRTADLVSYAPWVTWRVPAPSVAAIVLYYGAGIGAWVSWRRRRAVAPGTDRSAGAWLPSTCLAVAIVAAWWIAAPPALAMSPSGDGRLHVTFIDVGQGDSALVRLPGGGTWLIDAGGLAGGSFDIGDRIVGAVMRDARVRRLSTLVISHGDADHIGGALSVLREFRPWDVWDGVPVPRSRPLQALRTEAASAGTRWTTVQREDATSVGGVRLIVRHPPLPDWERQDVRNDDSVVVELRWRDVSVVFTGDIGREGEASIADRFEPAPLRVLKVPHHGSNTSSSEPFLRALHPDVAVISVGRSNNFGHPNPDVLDRYRRIGASIFRTDQDGAVEVDTDGRALHVSTFTGRRLDLSGPRRREEHEGVLE